MLSFATIEAFTQEASLQAFMAPILILMYFRLARVEERELEEEFGIAYKVYRGRVPAFIPRVIGYR